MEIWAHRGASAVAPENTLAAFQAAGRLGADAVELDVHMTADGELVVIHDATVQRTTQGRGYVQQLTLKQIRALDAGYKFGPQFRGERIPTLKEALEAIRSAGLCVNIELKSGAAPYTGVERRTVDLLVDMGMAERATVSSFQYDMLQRVQAAAGQVPVALLCTEFQPVGAAYAERFGASALHPALNTVTPPYMREAIVRGVAVRPYTVNAEADVRRLRAWGAAAVITDNPALAREALAAL